VKVLRDSGVFYLSDMGAVTPLDIQIVNDGHYRSDKLLKKAQVRFGPRSPSRIKYKNAARPFFTTGEGTCQKRAEAMSVEEALGQKAGGTMQAVVSIAQG
jgi:hypothetical protein